MPTRELTSVDEKTLQELVGGVPRREPGSGLAESLARVWGVPLKQLALGDLRLLVGQRLGLEYTVPLALAHVRDHPLANGTYYPGDVLNALVQLPEEWWMAHPAAVPDLVAALERALPQLDAAGVRKELEAPFQSALLRRRASQP